MLKITLKRKVNFVSNPLSEVRMHCVLPMMMGDHSCLVKPFEKAQANFCHCFSSDYMKGAV